MPMRIMAVIALVALALVFSGCASTNKQEEIGLKNYTNSSGGGETASDGDVVWADYVGTLDGGAVFDTSIKEEAQKAGLPLRPGYEPLEFIVGAGQMIKGFDEAVVGMKAGEEKKVRLPPAQAYGEYRKDLLVSVPRGSVPGDVKKGSQLQASNEMVGTIMEIGNESVKIDFNQELAGKALNFRIIVRKISKRFR